MNPIDRFEEYRDTELDAVILAIRNGEIKAGKYSHLIKIDKHPKVKKEIKYNENN